MPPTSSTDTAACSVFSPQDILDHASIGIFTSTPDGRFLSVNPAFARMYGYESPQVVIESFTDIARQPYIDPEDRHSFVRQLESSGEMVNQECRMRRRDGTVFWVSRNARAVRDEDGRIVAIQGFSTDISKRKQAEARALSNANFLNLLLETVPLAVFYKDREGRYQGFNKSFENFFGTSREALIGKSVFDINPPDLAQTYHAKDLELFESAGTQVYKSKVKNFRGEVRDVIFHKAALTDEDGVVTGLVGAVLDVTERMKAEQSLALAKEHAEAANQAKSEFLANMSHEIRTPINGIMGMMQLLETTPLDADQQQYVTLCKTSANRLTRLLSDILDLSRVEAGKMDIFEAEFIVQELGASVSDLFKVTARKKGVHLECSIDPDIPTHLVGDEARVRQVLFNLVGNALKFTKEGSVRLEMTSLGAAEDNIFNVLFSIFDTGIPDDKIDGLFKPFVQEDGSYTRSYQGAGLGLAIVHRLVELMNGNIHVESSLGQGTTVHVVLPFKLPAKLPGGL